MSQVGVPKEWRVRDLGAYWEVLSDQHLCVCWGGAGLVGGGEENIGRLTEPLGTPALVHGCHAAGPTRGPTPDARASHSREYCVTSRLTGGKGWWLNLFDCLVPFGIGGINM